MAGLPREMLFCYPPTTDIGIGIRFYLLNKYPAKIFMGDIASLTIGAYLALIAILLKVEFLLPLYRDSLILLP